MEDDERFGTIINPLMREDSMCGKYLRLDKSEVKVGEDVLVTWNLPEFLTDYQDWIGMYEKDEDQVEQYLQAKKRCQNYSQYGSIQWRIDEGLFTKRYTDVIFYYFNINQNEIIGSSTRLTVINPSAPVMDGAPLVEVDPHQLLSVTIKGLSAANLRCKVVGSNPDPYVKLTVVPSNHSAKLPHYNQLRMLPNCNGTVHPHWDNLDIVLVVLPTDILEVDVRDKFNVRYFRVSHFLGRAKVPLNQFVRSDSVHTLTFGLQSRLAIDHVQGSVTVTITNNGPTSSSTADFVSPQSVVEQMSFEDSVIINSENDGGDNLSVKESSVDSITVTTSTQRVNEQSDPGVTPSSPRNMVSPFSPRDEETKAFPNEEKSEAPPNSVGETFTSPPPTGGETIESPPPSSGETFALPPADGEVTITSLTNEDTITSLPPSSGETVASPPPSSGETVASPLPSNGETIASQSPKSTPGTSQYQRMWSWDDTTVTTAPAAGPFRRAVTCMNRPPPHIRQQPQQSFDVTVLRRGGSSFRSRSLRHHNHGGPLPPNWDMRMDSVGRHVYINHVDRSVSLYPPSVQSSMTSIDRQSSINEELGRYNERINYQHSSTLQLHEDEEEDKSIVIDQSMTSSARVPVNRSSFDQTVHSSNHRQDQRLDQGHTVVDQVTASTSNESTRKLEREPSVTTKEASSPAFLFITWNGVYEHMRSEGVKAIGDDFFSDPLVVKLFQYIRADHSIFKKYQHHPKLVAALNKFALTDCDLPDKWEKRLDQNGRAIFINHSNRSTSFVDPRLPYPGNNLKSSSTIKNWKAAARDKLEGIGTISTTTTTTTTTTATAPRVTATLDRSRYLTRGVSSDSDDDDEISRPRSRSMPSASRNVRTIERHRHLARRNRNAPQIAAVISDRHTLIQPRQPAQVQEVAETEEEVYQRRVVEFLRQDDIISIIAGRYDGPITDELRSTIREITEEGPSKLRSLDDDSEITFQLGLILSLFEDAIVHRARLPSSRDTRHQPSSQQRAWRPPSPIPRPPTPHSVTPPSPQQPLPVALLESTTMTQYGFTEGALNRFFSQDNITAILRDAGYVSGTVSDMVRGILTSGVASVIAQGNVDTNRILKFIIDAIQQKIEQYSGETRSSDIDYVPVETLTDAQILAFIMQPNLLDVLSQRYHPLPSLMKIVVLEIKYGGERAVNRKRNVDANLQKLIRDFYSEIKSYSRGTEPEEPLVEAVVPTQQRKNMFAIKLHAFQSKLLHAGYRSRSQKTLTVGRDTLLHDAYEAIMSCNVRDLRKMKIAVSFEGEEGLDYGGPSREFYFFVSRELFNPYYGLFEYSSVGSYTVQISPHSMDILDALQWFRFAGRFAGMAVVQGYLVDVFFARHVYKALLGQSYSVEDLQVIDLEFFNSLKYVLENDPEPLVLTFSIEEQSFGVITEHELIKGGKNIAVVEENKKQYVDLMVQHRLSKGMTKQTEAFVKGFKEMIPPSILTFDPQELEWLIAGQAQVDVADWKENTVYWGYEEDSEVIIWFWRLVKEYSNEQRLRLLQFITGTSSIPLEGFKGLKGSDGTNQQFTIDMDYSDNGDDTFPRAHTCFNRLDIPAYSSYNVLKSRLTRAIEETEAFGNA